MLDKALKNIKSLAPLNSGVLKDLRTKSEEIARVAQTEKEKLIDRVITSLLKDRDLGTNPEAVRAEVRARLFEQAKGDALFFQNIKYVNSLVTSLIPRTLQDVPQLKDNIIEKIIQDAKAHAEPAERVPAGHRGGAGRKPGRGGSRAGRGRHQGRTDGEASGDSPQAGTMSATREGSQVNGGRRTRDNSRVSSFERQSSPQGEGRREHNRTEQSQKSAQSRETPNKQHASRDDSVPE